ncbi:MAG TPA: hypothetical protein VME43_12440 [Bryobacteraceae bacterium]|nr:hypothetical protein [Bryobacteraceae bacterium]
MITSVLIIGFSGILLVYWFRYCCILLIRTHAEQQVADATAYDAQFSFHLVQERLRTETELDSLRRSLDRDYNLFAYLLEHAVGLQASSLEDRVLVLDYKVMQWWYRLTKSAAPEQARRALGEMAAVLGLLVGKMGERAAAKSQS